MNRDVSSPLTAALLADLASAPDVYPQQLDVVRSAVLLIRLDASAYRAASFLDDRILGTRPEGAWVPLEQVSAAVRGLRQARPLHFIFHAGHVGSTLVSRLLDEFDDVLPLREPAPLRTLADVRDVLGLPESLEAPGEFERLLALFLDLWSRGFDRTRCVVVKATSVAGRMADPVLSMRTSSKAAWLNVRPETYLATLLAGQNSALDLRGHGPGRIRRLQARLRVALAPLYALSVGELAAMSWLAETWAQHEAQAAHGARIVAIDFDRFLAGVEENLGLLLRHFGIEHDDAMLARAAQSPALTRYSKAPEYAYSPADRTSILEQSQRANREEIRKGMNWLERVAAADAAAAAVLERATAGAGG